MALSNGFKSGIRDHKIAPQKKRCFDVLLDD